MRFLKIHIVLSILHVFECFLAIISKGVLTIGFQNVLYCSGIFLKIIYYYLDLIFLEILCTPDLYRNLQIKQSFEKSDLYRIGSHYYSKTK